MARCALAATLLLVLAGCGQKGPLYRPDGAATPSGAASAPAGR